MEIFGSSHVSATDVQLSQPLSPTPVHIERYRQNLNWRLYEKEWIFRNVPPNGRSWLDFGCGTGEITTQLALLGASHVTAVDITPGLVEMTRKQAELDQVAGRVHALCGDITRLDPEPVDVAISFAVLHHVPGNIEAVARSIRRWLKPGGIFVFCEPVSYLPGIDWIRYHSGVGFDALDPGERKLTRRDIALIEQNFKSARQVHFRTVARLNRLLPSSDRGLRRLDAAVRHVPGSRFVAGTVIGVCQA